MEWFIMVGEYYLADDELPKGFLYPNQYKRIVDLGLVDLEPWHIMSGKRLSWRNSGLKHRYPLRTLIPFAERQDNDDVACWEVVSDKTRTVRIHDFADAGWEQKQEYEDFYAWFTQAVADLVEFDL
jgi:hypothetical protein